MNPLASPSSISTSAARLLTEQREWLNSRYSQRRAQGAKIESQAWLRHVQQRIIPLLDAVETVLPERSPLVLRELYDISLDLFSVGHFSETDDLLHANLVRLWHGVLANAPKLLARDPRRFAGSLSNGLLYLAQSRPESVDRWLTLLEATVPNTEAVDDALGVGKVAAWLCGLAEYRLPALSIAATLPPTLVTELLYHHLKSSVLDETVKIGPDNLSTFLETTVHDPWHSPHQNESLTGSQPRQVATCGAFTGFGGVFLEPPRVFSSNNQLYAADREHTWRLSADLFGSSFHREESVTQSSAAKHHPAAKPHTALPHIDDRGILHWPLGQSCATGLTSITSHAYDGVTLAVTIATSFHIYLFTGPRLREGKT